MTTQRTSCTTFEASTTTTASAASAGPPRSRAPRACWARCARSPTSRCARGAAAGCRWGVPLGHAAPCAQVGAAVIELQRRMPHPPSSPPQALHLIPCSNVCATVPELLAACPPSLTSLQLGEYDNTSVLGDEGNSFPLRLDRFPGLAEFALSGDPVNTYCPPSELTRLSFLRCAAAAACYGGTAAACCCSAASCLQHGRSTMPACY